MLIKEEKYIYVIKITRLICVDNIITVGAHVVSSNPASLVSPASVTLNTLIAGVEGRAGNALPTAVSKLLIMPLSCIWPPSSMAHIPWFGHSTPNTSPGSTEAPVPLCTTSETSHLLLGNFRLQCKISSKVFKVFFPELPPLEIRKIKNFLAYVQLTFSSLRN